MRNIRDNRSVSGKSLIRAASIQSKDVDVENRLIHLSFSSETPYERGGRLEILGHEPGDYDISRLENRGMLLFNHKTDDYRGVIERAWVEGKRGSVIARIKEGPVGDETLRDAKAGILTKASFQYRYTEKPKDLPPDERGVPRYRAKWRATGEVSLVTMPADDTVGIGRMEDFTDAEPDRSGSRSETSTNQKTEQNKMSEQASAVANPPQADGAQQRAATTVDVRVIENEALARERNRVAEIEASAAAPMVRSAVKDIDTRAKVAKEKGTAAQEFKDEIWRAMCAMQTGQVNTGYSGQVPEKDLGKWSWGRAVEQAIVAKAGGRLDGIEGELHTEALRGGHQGKGGLIIPWSVLNHRSSGGEFQRDQLVGTANLGGAWVGTQLQPASFIEMLRIRTAVLAQGVRLLTGLTQNPSFPRQLTQSSTAWMATEGTAAGETNITVDVPTMTPKTLHAFVDVGTLVNIQAQPGMDAIVREDLRADASRKIEAGILYGNGAGGQPTGIASTAGIGSVVGGVNGAALTWSHIVKLKTAVAAGNGDPGMGAFIINSVTQGRCEETEKFTGGGREIWAGGPTPLAGQPAGVTNLVRSNLTKGTSNGICSELFFGVWSDSFFGLYGNGFELLADPYTQASTRLVRVHMYAFADFLPRHPANFSYMADALTP